MSKIQVGDTLPTIALNDENGSQVELNDYIGKPFIIYFYPKDDTPGCTKEACKFRDDYAEFEDAGVKVFGISADSPRSHKAFKEKYRLPFSLLSDRGNKVRKAFGVPSSLFGLLPGRVTYVIDANGKVCHIFNSQFAAEQHVTEALKVIKSL